MPGALVLLRGVQAVYTEGGSLHLQGLTSGPLTLPRGAWALYTASEEFSTRRGCPWPLPAFPQGL